MSYASGGNGRSKPARTPLLTPPERANALSAGSPGGSPQTSPRGQEDKRGVTDAIEKIKRYIDDVQREKRNLFTPAPTDAGKKKVDESTQLAKSTRQEATRLLDGLSTKSRTAASGYEEKNHKRMMIQKLTDDLDGVWQGFEAACRAYETASADKERRQGTSAVASLGAKSVSEKMPSPRQDIERGERPQTFPPGAADRGAVFASGQGVELKSVEPESGHQVQTLQQQEIVGEGELELHDAIVDEFGRDIGVLASDIRSLQGAMVDLAQHASNQGEVLDNIESLMGSSAEATGGATEQLVQANVTHRRGNKMIYCMLILAAILSIIIIVVAILRHRD